MNEMFNEYKALFIEEAEEYVAALNDNLVNLEKDPSDRKLIDNIFRIAHTLKSSAAAVGLTDLSGLAHKAEDVMQKVRSGETSVSAAIIDAFFEVFDIIRTYIDAVKRGKDPVFETRTVLAHLADAAESRDTAGTEIPATTRPRLPVRLSEEDQKLISSVTENGVSVYRADVVIDPREPLKWLRAELVMNKISKFGKSLKIFPEKSLFIRNDFDGYFTVLLGSVESAEKLRVEMAVDLIKEISVYEYAAAKAGVKPESQARPDAAPVPPKTEEKTRTSGSSARGKSVQAISAPASNAAEPSRQESKPADEAEKKDQQKTKISDTIRVGIDKLDVMMNLIGELATTVSGFRQIEKKALGEKNTLYNDISLFIDRLSNISSDLQFSIMNTRMLPVSTVFNQYNRVVRDLSHEEGKEVDLAIKGEETELDKKIIDTIGEPLMHLVRNAVGHGIEPAEIRKAAGKPVRATVTLAAERSGNRIVVSVSDDGGGIDVSKVKRKAVEKALVSQADADSQSDEQNMQYIFHPGFSTAEKVSSVSGRGVGLDVVKNVVSELSGSVDVRTETGKGTEFVILLPLTLTTTSVILARAGGSLFAVPISDILETLVVTRDEFKSIDGTLAFNLRGEVLPVLGLSEVFEGKAADRTADKQSVMVVFYKDKKVGLIIDRVEGNEEIVLKNLEKNYRSLKGVSGAAILGDGRISLVLDIPGIMQIVRDRQSGSSRPGGKKVRAVRKTGGDGKKTGVKPAGNAGAGPASNAKVPGLFNRAFEQATRSLSQLTGRQMSIQFKSVNEYEASEQLVGSLTEKPEEIFIGSLIKTKEGLSSNIVLLISDSEGRGLYDLLYGNPSGTTATSGEDVVLAMGEINNILSSAFINTVANTIGREVHPSTPMNCRDMLAALMQAVVTQEELIGRRVLCAETVIIEEGRKEFHPRMLIITDQTGLSRIEAGAQA